MNTASELNDDAIDDEAHSQIINCITARPPKSFFLFAGAGSGKTRSLIIALNAVRKARSRQLSLGGQHIGVITYTNAACDEIKRRMDFDPLFDIRTIHSFVWELIRGFYEDIRNWLNVSLRSEIAELEDAEARGRAGTKAAIERQAKLKAKRSRLAALSAIRRFTYSPTGDNQGRDALNHSEVIKIAAEFLDTKPLMGRVLLCRCPILLIDESQDTNKDLVEALLALQQVHSNEFALGLFGDMMQRIYTDGKPDLGVGVPADWATPSLSMNHRSPNRIVRLINEIRKSTDGRQQKARSDRGEGFVRLFICPQSVGDKYDLESRARMRMAEICGECAWSDGEQVKTLILEHLMAARRMDFLELFEPLYRIERFRTGLLDGSLPGIRFFTEIVLPLSYACRDGDSFASAAIVRKASPLITSLAANASLEEQQSRLKAADAAVRDLSELFKKAPRLCDILKHVWHSRLFNIPESLLPFTEESAIVQPVNADVAADPDPNEESNRLRQFLTAPFGQVERYEWYVSGTAPFDTHQGVKGLEFPRVLVVIDDEEAAGFSFAYDKLFGIKAKTKSDLDNERSGKDSSIDRTRRLFYVTCSRSQHSLAIVAHTSNPEALQQCAVENGWFEQSEIEVLK